ncbi:MAG: hypothetical protein ACRC6E_14525 [Fusobacteriaceae bacterium]
MKKKLNIHKDFFKILILGILILNTGCSAIMESIGNNKIETAISQYNQLGVSEASFENISKGLNYLPQSPVGIDNLKKQYADLTLEKNNIYLKKQYNNVNVKRLKLYIYASEKITNLKSKIEELKNINTNSTLEREKFIKFSDEYIKNMNSKNLSREEKIQLLKEYEELTKYSQSALLKESIYRLKNEVIIKYHTVLNSRFHSRDYDLRYLFAKTATNSSLNKVKRYTQYMGNVEMNNWNYSRDNIIVIDITSLNFNSLKSELIKKDENGNHLIFREEKELVLRGYYREMNSKSFSRKDLETFEFREKFNFEIEKNGLNISFSREKEVVESILEEIFEEILNYDLPKIVNENFDRN